jgi:outer membrane protein assembly factor BamB
MRLLLAVALAASVHAADPADWPRFGGPKGDGWSPATGLNKDWQAKAPKELWRATLGDRGYAGPAAAAGSVYIIDHEGTQDIVRALDLATGKERWRFAYPDADKDNYGFARATPAVDGGRVFTLSRLGKLHCLDAKTGGKAWAVDIQAEFKGQAPQWQYSASPIVVGNGVVVSPGGPDAAVVALDKATGKPLWRGGGSDKPGYDSPVVQGDRLLLMTGAHLAAIDLKSGKSPWSFPWKTSYDVNSAAPVVTDAGIFITSGYGSGCALIAIDGGKPKEVWRSKVVQSHMNTPIHHQGFIYATTDPGALVCIEAKSGAERWRTKGFGKAGLLAADGCLIVQDDKSGDLALVAIDPAAFKELGRVKPFQGGGDFWAPPILADRKLIARSKTELVCLDLR